MHTFDDQLMRVQRLARARVFSPDGCVKSLDKKGPAERGAPV